MLDFLRKHTIVIMAAMALVFVGLMFIGGDVQGGSMSGLFKKTYVSVDGKSYGEKDYANMGAQALDVAGRFFPTSFSILTEDYFYNSRINTSPEEYEIVNSVYSALKTNNPNAAFLAYRGIIRREAERLGLTPNREEVDAAIQRMPELCTDGKFDAKKYDEFITLRGPMGKKNQEELLRGLMEDTISLIRISEVLTSEIAVDPDFAKAVAESASQKITVNTAFLNKLLFKPKSDPGEAEIKSYWEKFKNNYKNEEARFITVYTFIPNGDATPGEDGGLSNATLETLNLIQELTQALDAVNAKDMDKVVATIMDTNPDVCKLEKKHYHAIKLSQPVEELQLPVNTDVSDGSGQTLMEVAFRPASSSDLDANADEKAIEAARAKTGMNQLGSPQILTNGSVALVRVDGITPIKPLPFEEAREAAKTDLIATMTVEELNKAAKDLKAEVEKSATPIEQFNEIATKYGASVTAYGPFISAEPPKELPAPGMVFGNAALINPGKVAEPIDTGDGLLVVQLVKREVEDTPMFGMLSSQIVPSALASSTARMIRLDWLKGCINRYKVSIEPGLNQQN